MRVVDVELLPVEMGTNWLTERLIANPMSLYPEYAGQRSSWYRTMTAGVVRVTGEDGSHGLGFVGGGKGTAAAIALADQLRDLVVGKDIFQTELVQEQLFRATVFYGLGGFTQSLISGIDIALWDLKGKAVGRPVYDLLGGKTADVLRPYLTSWDATALEEFGIRDVKVAMPHGPADGKRGMRANVEAVAKARDVVGSEGFIALDCYMGWDVPYTITMARLLADYNIEWIEEPVMPEDVMGYRRIRESVDCMVTGGEHTYTLEGFRRLIVDGGVDIVQPDIYRAGGPTGLKKIAALAKAHGTKLICHGVGAPTYHFLISNGPEVSPRCEYLDIYAGGAAEWVLTDDPRPRDGTLALSAEPGFGYALNEEVINNGSLVSAIW